MIFLFLVATLALSAILLNLPLIFLSALVRILRPLQDYMLRDELGSEHLAGKKFVGFFHPYCNAGGGGERVLWTAISHIQRTRPDVICVVYSGDTDASKEEIVEKVKARFDISLEPSSLYFVFLHTRILVEESTWPFFTLLGQSIGSMILAWEAITSFIPDIYIDTMGYAFTYPLLSWVAGVPVGAYVHYPTISTDMLARVRERVRLHNNAGAISSSPLLSSAKVLYYRAFMATYSHCLHWADFLMANSSWTKAHVDSILRHRDILFDHHGPMMEIVMTPANFVTSYLPTRRVRAHVDPEEALRVYPPCDTRSMSSFALEGRERIILSIAQFRPEKDHAMQIRALHALFQEHPDLKSGPRRARLVLIGGVRNGGDAARVKALRDLAQKLDVADSIDFEINASYPDMLSYLSRSSVGLHTMVDEHFGINVVEFMAAGVIPVAHASAGPLLDIVTPVDGQPTGFHAKTAEEFARALHDALSLPIEEDVAMRARGRDSAIRRFSEKEFELGWEASGWQTWL